MKSALKDRLVNEMEFYFGKDTRRINHAKRVLGFCDELLGDRENSRGVNELVVIAAAVLHDIGIHACEKKYNSTQGQLQEKESPRIAKAIMEKLNLEERIIKEVCAIIASHHSPGEIDSQNFKVLWDADWLVNLRDEVNLSDKDNLSKVINKTFLTKKGRRIAQRVYLEKGE